MFSDRLYTILYVLTLLGNKCGSCFISVNLKTRCFVISEYPKIISRMKRNYNLTWIWAFASLALVGKFYIMQEIERHNITLFFGIIGFSVLVIYSVLRWFTNDLILATNSSIILFRHLHSKYILSDPIYANVGL